MEGGGRVGDGFGASAFQDIWLSGNYLRKDINSYFYVYKRGTVPINSVPIKESLLYYKVNLLVAF